MKAFGVVFAVLGVVLFAGQTSLAQKPDAGTRFEQMMTKLDKNGDGALGIDELPPKLQERLAAADTNGDGAIDQSEMMTAMKNRAQGGPAGQNQDGMRPGPLGGQNAQEVFVRFDANGDGALDLAEFESFLQKVRSQRGMQDGSGNPQRPAGNPGKRKRDGENQERGPQKPKRPAADNA